MSNKLPKSFYQDSDVVTIAKNLIGCYLYTNIDDVITGGIITETEAYNGIIDKASHAYGGRRTQRTNVMYENGGITYVYMCYGIHYMLNVVTGPIDTPDAVLIRGIYPMLGIDKMLSRTNKLIVNYQLTNGPGKVTKALGIKKEHNALDYNGSVIWIEEHTKIIDNNDIQIGPRIGIDYAGADAHLPYRFVLNHKNYK